MSAQAFAASLGPGVNIMAANIRHDVLDEHDFIGLGHRIGHIRLCGDVLKGLINWSTCPGTSWRPPANASDDEAIDLARERIVSDPGFTSYVRAARRVLRAGLKLVLNPLHWKFMLQIDQRTLQLFWGAMLREFNTTDFPVDRVAFEMANEPGNWNRWSVENRAMDLLPGFAAQVSAAQPERVLVLPAGEMGWPRCGPDGPAAHFVQSWLAAIDDGALAFRTRFANAPNAIATFHYYDPRYFTNQPQGSAREWDLPTGRASVASNFDTLRRAFPSNVPLYLGEFGLNVQYVPPQSGADWLFAVRAEAEAHGMPWSLWTYYTSDEGVVTSAVSGDGRFQSDGMSPTSKGPTSTS